jgi:hypothetical protein
MFRKIDVETTNNMYVLIDYFFTVPKFALNITILIIIHAIFKMEY